MVGLSAEDEVVLGNDPEGNETIVVVVRDGAVLAWVEFGRDPRGRYYPNYVEVCASAGIQDFTFER